MLPPEIAAAAKKYDAAEASGSISYLDFLYPVGEITYRRSLTR